MNMTRSPSPRAVCPPPKRSARSEHEGRTRSKRQRYAAVACNECKKRKLKCINDGSGTNCERCVTGGVPCIFASEGFYEITRDKVKEAQNFDSSAYQKSLEETSSLREQVAALTRIVDEITRSGQSRSLVSKLQDNHNPVYAPATNQETGEPKESYFVGHTKPAFSLGIARTSLGQMGIATELPPLPSTPESLAASADLPTPKLKLSAAGSDLEKDCLLSISMEEVVRLIGVFEDEVESLYPLLSCKEMAVNAHLIMNFAKDPSKSTASEAGKFSRVNIGIRDVQMLKMVISTAIVTEARCKNDLSTKMVDEVEEGVCKISGYSFLGLKELQLWAMLSIYYFHCDEDVLAWRSIGISARMALEMGLHRRESLLHNFREENARDLAVRAFWCVYVLDRRSSFGTSLSFALADGDIDPELPMPGEDFQSLRCLMAHGRLCSKVWNVLPPVGSPQQLIPEDTVAFLDFLTQRWLTLIPSTLQLQHPRLKLAPGSQPRTRHRLRVLLYLHSNHLRTLIYRHHLLSSANIMADTASSRVVVGIALDTIEVLVDLNNTSDIYERQQSTFNYFLLSALSVILLAVCHAPALFATQCRESFIAAVDLVKGFSRRSFASRRLWECIKGMLPGIKSLELQSCSTTAQKTTRASSMRLMTGSQAPVTQGENQNVISNYPPIPEPNFDLELNNIWTEQGFNLSPETPFCVPDASKISDDLIGLFDAFGQANGTQPLSPNPVDDFFGFHEHDLLAGNFEEISRSFHGLI
ncbi:fungal-specific transcription factor [Cadophora sp. DSE1049]|nr:fungal-specific transcription factor [Cadophora sp. DSE1049]